MTSTAITPSAGGGILDALLCRTLGAEQQTGIILELCMIQNSIRKLVAVSRIFEKAVDVD